MDPGREDRAAPMDADDGHALAGVSLDDLVCDAHECVPDVLGSEDDLLVVVHVAPSWPLGTGLKGLRVAGESNSGGRRSVYAIADFGGL